MGGCRESYAATLKVMQTSLVSRAIDAFQNPSKEARSEVHDQLLKYLETDTVWYA